MRRFIFEASNQFATVIRREHPEGDYVLYSDTLTTVNDYDAGYRDGTGDAAAAAVEKAREEYRDEIVARLIRERENYDVHTREWSALERAVEIASTTPPTEG